MRQQHRFRHRIIITPCQFCPTQANGNKYRYIIYTYIRVLLDIITLRNLQDMFDSLKARICSSPRLIRHPKVIIRVCIGSLWRIRPCFSLPDSKVITIRFDEPKSNNFQLPDSKVISKISVQIGSGWHGPDF